MMARQTKADRIAQLEAEIGNIRAAWTQALQARDKAIDLANTNHCSCRCHTGKCGENAMVLAERTIGLVTLLGANDLEALEAITNLVDSAGVDFARAALDQRCDDEVPF